MFKYVITTEHPDEGVAMHEYMHSRCDDMGAVLEKLEADTGMSNYMISCEVYDADGNLMHGVERVDRDDELHSFVDLIEIVDGNFVVKMDNPREAILMHALVAVVSQLVEAMHNHSAAENPECVLNIIDNVLYQAEEAHSDIAVEMMTKNREEDGDWRSDFGGPVS